MNKTHTLKTKTGDFPIGFRKGGSGWQTGIKSLIDWANANQFAFMDLGNDADQYISIAEKTNMEIGSVDLPYWNQLISANPETRKEAVEKANQYIETCSVSLANLFFVVMLPEDPSLDRKENFSFMLESFQQLVPTLEANNSHVVIEGWPGLGSLCCTPETYRALFKEISSHSIGINYDPSHLIRMGIEPIRFLNEFSERIFHVHAKDTEILQENLYEYGHELPATFTPAINFGEWSWRYTIPGKGVTDWKEVFSLLAKKDYYGLVSIELEDSDYNGSSEGEKEGLLSSLQFLSTI